MSKKLYCDCNVIHDEVVNDTKKEKLSQRKCILI